MHRLLLWDYNILPLITKFQWQKLTHSWTPIFAWALIFAWVKSLNMANCKEGWGFGMAPVFWSPSLLAVVFLVHLGRLLTAVARPWELSSRGLSLVYSWSPLRSVMPNWEPWCPGVVVTMNICWKCMADRQHFPLHGFIFGLPKQVVKQLYRQSLGIILLSCIQVYMIVMTMVTMMMMALEGMSMWERVLQWV